MNFFIDLIMFFWKIKFQIRIAILNKDCLTFLTRFWFSSKTDLQENTFILFFLETHPESAKSYPI